MVSGSSSGRSTPTFPEPRHYLGHVDRLPDLWVTGLAFIVEIGKAMGESGGGGCGVICDSRRTGRTGASNGRRDGWWTRCLGTGVNVRVDNKILVWANVSNDPTLILTKYVSAVLMFRKSAIRSTWLLLGIGQTLF